MHQRLVKDLFPEEIAVAKARPKFEKEFAALYAKDKAKAQKKLDDAKKAIDNMTAEMQKNKVLSKETLEKYMELQQLMLNLLLNAADAVAGNAPGEPS